MTEELLEKYTFMVKHVVSANLVEDLAIMPTVETYHAYIERSVVSIIRQDIFGKQLDAIAYPLNWKEAIKDAFITWMQYHFPAIGDMLKQRVYVKRTIINIFAYYPKIKPDEYGVISYRRKDE